MKRILWIMIFVSVSLSSAHGGERDLATYVQNGLGDPTILHLNYHGGIAEWDAGASIANGTLILSNAMFISITNSKGESVKPIADKVLAVWADTLFRNPFDLVLDVSEFYDLSQTGKYVVQWGCRDVKSDSVRIEIVD